MTSTITSATKMALASDDKRPAPMEWSFFFSQLARRPGVTQEQRSYWTIMAASVIRAQVFEFGTVRDEQIISESKRGGQLWGRHLRLPFDTVIYGYNFVPDLERDPAMAEALRGADMSSMRYCTIATQLPSSEYKERPDLLGFTLAADFAVLPTATFATTYVSSRYVFDVTLAAQFISKYDEQGKQWGWRGTCIDSSYTNTSNETFVHLDHEPSYIAMRPGALGSVADGVVALSMMLATRGIPMHAVDPPRRVNAKREKRGKPPLVRVTYVDTAKYFEARHNTVTRGTHISPVPHLRRGHIRHLATGREVWVRDSLVNCQSLAELESRDHYDVNKGE